jgi:hypothetical protein
MTRGPERWLEQPADAPSEYAKAAAAYRAREPSERALQRMLEGVRVASLSGTRPAFSAPRSWWKTLMGIVATGAVVLMGALWRSPREVPTAKAPARLSPAQTSPLPHSTPASPALPAAQPMRESSPVPKHEARARPAKPRDAVDAAGELALLTRARRALESAPAQTLVLTDEHSRRFRRGLFGEERELLAIDALVRLSHDALAQERARRFRQRYPRSMHLRRLESSLAGERKF